MSKRDAGISLTQFVPASSICQNSSGEYTSPGNRQALPIMAIGSSVLCRTAVAGVAACAGFPSSSPAATCAASASAISAMLGWLSANTLPSDTPSALLSVCAKTTAPKESKPLAISGSSSATGLPTASAAARRTSASRS
ncbi:Uncharacterised protein [Serratia entomophila]|nr:Uncharacterised protein [Serratia entomophila]